jgi:hypothetical protein
MIRSCVAHDVGRPEAAASKGQRIIQSGPIGIAGLILAKMRALHPFVIE